MASRLDKEINLVTIRSICSGAQQFVSLFIDQRPLHLLAKHNCMHPLINLKNGYSHSRVWRMQMKAGFPSEKNPFRHNRSEVAYLGNYLISKKG